MSKNKSDDGLRIRVPIFGENYYLTIVRCADGGIDVHPTVPRENDPSMSRERQAVEMICKEFSAATRRV